MPAVSSPKMYSAASHSSTTPYHPAPQKLRAVSPEEQDSWSDGDSDSTLIDPYPTDIDEPWVYSFRPGQSVWIRTVGGKWHPGRVSGQTTRKGQTRQREGLFYPVVFCGRVRKYFAPLNGEIKPDTPHVRRLLKEAGVLT